jgi:hypothetical protein
VILTPHHKDPLQISAVVYALGDSAVTLLRSTSGKMEWHSIYETGPADFISSYISSKKGIVGKPFLTSQILYPGDVITLSTDGAKIRWYSGAGFAGEPFKKIVNGTLCSEFDQENLAGNWLSFLVRQIQSLDDDAAIVVAKLVEKKTN